MAVDTCKGCGVPIQEFITGRKKIRNEFYCKKCYYKKLGDLIEERPVGSPLLVPAQQK